MTTKEQKVILKMLNKYRDLPQLWDKSHQHYKNKYIRKEAFKVLLEIFKEVNEFATLKTVNKKIDNLRTNYAKELKKVEEANKVGHNYEPTLFYYDAASFLRQNYLAYFENHTIDSADAIEVEATEPDSPRIWLTDPDEETCHDDLEFELEENNDSNKDPFDSHEMETYILKTEPYEKIQPRNSTRKRKYVSNSSTHAMTDNHRENCQAKLECRSVLDEFDAYGKYVATALKSMDVGKALRVQLKLQSILTAAKIESLRDKS